MFFRWVRDLHLYFGLFISPFILLFAASVFYVNHAKLTVSPTSAETHQHLRIPDGLDRLKGREAVERARAILPQIGVTGEIGFLRYLPNERKLFFPVSTAVEEATVEVNLATQSARVTRRRMAFWESLAYLHKSPGPHNAAIRGNWVGTRVWRGFADATIALLLFISISGLYLWWAIRSERVAGLVLLGSGTLTVGALAYAVIR